MDSEPPTFALFAYGTLKRGFPAHERFFEEKPEVEEVMARGELFDLPAGYPALAVPGKDILATGTANPLADAETQRGTLLARQIPPASGETVHGEMIRFDDPERRLPALDAFEGFNLEGESLYMRVLIPAWTASGETFPAWAYVMESPSSARLHDGRWPLPEP